jgi:hypothetical protein
MSQQSSTIDRVRQLMEPGNPAPAGTAAGSWDDEQGQQAYRRIVAITGTGDGGSGSTTGAALRRQRGRHLLDGGSSASWRSWRSSRTLAPVAAGLAVVALVVSLAVVGGSHSTRPGGPGKGGTKVTTDMPSFYVTLSQDPSTTEVFASVHSSDTGQVLSQVAVGSLGLGGAGIAAEPSGHAFFIYQGLPGRRHELATFLLRVSDGGRSAKLQRLRFALVPRGSNDWVEGIAVSADGKHLAAVLQPGSGSLQTHPQIRVYSLTGGATQTWTAPGDAGSAWSPVWTGSTELTFVWQDHLRGSASNFYIGRSEVRVLTTRAPGHNFLLDSTVIATETTNLSMIQTAGAGPADSPLAAAVIQVTSIGGHGTETLQLDELSGTGAVTKVLTSNSTSYSGELQEGGISSRCQILGVAADGAMLAESPHLGRIVDGRFTPLAHSAGVFAAAW